MLNKYTIDDLGYDRVLVKSPVLEDYEFPEDSTTAAAVNSFSGGTAPATIASGDMVSNFNVAGGYLQSANFATGVTGWKFDALGNLEANSGTFRGSLYAEVGNIGDWVISTSGLYYDGTGTPSIRTAATVGSGSNGVLMDKDGIKVYDDVLGMVVNLPSDGSAPSFSSGIIQETIFEINTNAVLRTSETVGDGSADSAGVLINNSGFYACEANQTLGNANVRIDAFGNGYFSGTIDAAVINSSEFNGGTINGMILTGGLIRTAETGQRTEIDNQGITLLNGAIAATYGDVTYAYGNASRTYGSGVLAYVNNADRKIPFYVNSEQEVGDMHFFNRLTDPTGTAEIGDLAVVDGRLKICIVAGTPGGWEVVGVQTAVSSPSSSRSPSTSPSASSSRSPSVSPSISPSISPSSS